MRRAARALLLLSASDAAPAPPDSCAPVELFRDDFSRLPPGWLSNPVLTNGILNGAIQEYFNDSNCRETSRFALVRGGARAGSYGHCC